MDDFGEFLYLLRKEKGMTQAQLAEKLGVTNKAVSKWETGEAMPETSLLIPISRIFDVTVDELLAGKRSENKSENASEEKIDDNLFTRGKDDDVKTVAERVVGSICAIVVFAGLLTYFLLGIIGELWHPYWVIIPSCALFSGIIGTMSDIFNVKKREIKKARGENPYTGAICGVVMLSSMITYLLLGAFLNLWHPLWVIVVAGAFLCVLIAMIGEIINIKKK